MDPFSFNQCMDAVMRFAVLNGWSGTGSNETRTRSACEFVIALGTGIPFRGIDLPNAQDMARRVKAELDGAG